MPSKPIELARKHAPVFHFHPQEGAFCCYPSSADAGFAQLQSTGSIGERRVPRTLQKDTPCYWEYSAQADGSPSILRFWLWYRFNDFPTPLDEVPPLGVIGSHPSDWESIVIYLSDDSPICYCFSNHHGARVHAPSELTFTADGRVNAWVALGTHAHYESPTVSEPFSILVFPDQIASGGSTLDSQKSLTAVADTSFGRAGFAGDWGDGFEIFGPPSRDIHQYDSVAKPLFPQNKTTTTNTNTSNMKLDIQRLGRFINKQEGWYDKHGSKAAYLTLQDHHYRTWWPTISPTPSGGLLISTKIDHDIKWAGDDHAFPQLTFGKKGELLKVSVGISFGDDNPIFSSGIIPIVGSVFGVPGAAVGKVVEKLAKFFKGQSPGRVQFPNAVEHNINWICKCIVLK